MSNKIEEWRDIVGYEGSYQVSNFGKVRSLDRTIIQSNCSVGVFHKGTLFSLSKDKDGYLKVNLKLKGRKTRRFFVHRLVAIAFILNPDNKPIINHKNGIKYDNNVDNLEWCTHSENTIHAHVTGLIIPNEPNVGYSGSKSTMYYEFDMLDLNEKYIRTFCGTGDIAKFLKIKQAPHVISCSKGRLKTAYGYKWRYTDGKPKYGVGSRK